MMSDMPGRNVIRQPHLYVVMIGVNAAQSEGPPDTPVGEGDRMATLIIETGGPAVSAPVNVAGNDAMVLVVSTITSTSLKLYAAATLEGTLYPIMDASGSQVDVSVGSSRCVHLGDLLKGVNYFAVLPNQAEAAQRSIPVLLVPR